MPASAPPFYQSNPPQAHLFSSIFSLCSSLRAAVRSAALPHLFSSFLSLRFYLFSQKNPPFWADFVFYSFSSPGSTGETRFFTLDITIDVLVEETPLTLFRSSRSFSRDFVVSVQTFRRKSLLPVTT